MQRILVPVDGSEPALCALDFLGRLQAARLALELRLIYVQAMSSYPAEYIPARMMEALLEAERLAQAKALEAASLRAAAAGLAASAVGAHGCPAEEIVREAREWKADQIAMGTRGLGAVKTLVLGSVAQSVVHLSHLPVTLVK